MLRKFLFSLLLSIALTIPALSQAAHDCRVSLGSDIESARAVVLSGKVASKAKNSLGFKTELDLNQHTGISFLSFMKEEVKPRLDKYAEEGFTIASKEVVLKALSSVSPKVKRGALKAAGSVENLGQVAEALAGQNVSFYQLPQKIADLKIRGVDRYSLSTFIALASGGGVAVKLAPDCCQFNVNYGTGKTAKDEMTGRSFGEGPTHPADDASDASYLRALQNYVEDAKENGNDFYSALLKILTNSDPSDVSKVSPEGQSVLSDFVAIYIAEQDRHLMSNMRSHAWDVSLLEVTLLSALHAGQEKFMVMFNGELREEVPAQARGGEVRDKMKKADMTDWWQFSSNPDPAYRNRSGINVTKKDFRALGLVISNHMRAKHPALVKKIEAQLTGVKLGGNIFQEFTDFLINDKTARSIENSDELVKNFVQFLATVRAEANEITTSQIERQNGPVK